MYTFPRSRFVKGHDFSRADKANQIHRALAPEGSFMGDSRPISTFSAACLAPESQLRGQSADTLGSCLNLSQPATGARRKGDISHHARKALTGPKTALLHHWPLYLSEAAELAIFMISACCFTVWLYDPAYPALHLIPLSALRRLLMGIAMGLTAIGIIHSPMGQRSGAHFNPAITLTYLRLGKIPIWDAIFYILFQFLGGAFGVALSAIFLGPSIAVPSVNYAVTVPGRFGTAAAFFAELFMATLLMAVVLWFSNRPSLAKYTSYLVGVLILFYILLFAPVSGFSINPARTVASALFAHLWTALWLYFVAPISGMMLAAEFYLRIYGIEKVLCAKLHPSSRYPCSFLCNFPDHLHPERPHSAANLRNPTPS